MKRYIHYPLFILAVVLTLLSEKSVAQTKLGIKSASFPAVVYVDSSYALTVTVQNKGTQAYTGPVTISYSGDSSLLTSTFTVAVTLNPNDTIRHIATVMVSLTNFHLGSNIIVVWPTGSNFITYDSAYIHTYVNEVTTGIKEEANYSTGIVLFPNPATDQLLISSASQVPIEQVSVSDASGNEIFVTKNYKQGNYTINTGSYKPGVYFIGFIFEDGSRINRKFVKE